MALSLSSCASVHLHSEATGTVKGCIEIDGHRRRGSSSNNLRQRNRSQNKNQIQTSQSVEKLVPCIATPTPTPPLESLQSGNWVKLICGASFEDVVDIRNLSLVYTLARVDCVDCAADASVVSAVNQGIDAALAIASVRRPWVMISVNDHQDLHFRKAAFDPSDCPLDCSRPCEAVCPANAIALFNNTDSLHLEGGVITERCYGCGRCLPVCPYDQIKAVTYLRDAVATAQLVKRNDVDAIEIHTNGRQTTSFEEFWNGMGDSVSHLSLVAISLPDVGKSATTLMSKMFSIMRPKLSCYNLWQLDGRPMSGDIGRGATRESLAFAVRLAVAEDRPPGFLQLAGGTNAHTVNGLKQLGLFQTKRETKDGSCNSLVGGIAYGGYARKIVGRILRSMQSQHGLAYIEDYPAYLSEALSEALALVGPVKCYCSIGIDRDE